MDSLDLLHADECTALVEQAVMEQRAGRTQAAQHLYRAALQKRADHPEANHNLAILLLQAGRSEQALGHFRKALESDADRELYWLSYARALLLAGRTSEALSVLEEGQTHVLSRQSAEPLLAHARAALGQGATVEGRGRTSSLALMQAKALAARGEHEAAARRLRNAIDSAAADADQLLLELGDILAEAGATCEAIESFEQALQLNPDFAEAHYHLGSILSENDQIARGFEHFMRHAELIHSKREVSGSEPLHKTKHDKEQAAHLAQEGVAAGSKGLPFRLGDGTRLDGPILNVANPAADLMSRWQAARPQFLVIDDFLTLDALQKLRDFCADSTVWKRVYDAGYIGATPADGFACPLLAQMIEEIQEAYAPILNSQPFRYLGAFKYDSELSTGTNTHADFSAVNVNLYIAPDTANRDPERGGMLIWDLEANSESALRFYNGNEEALNEHIKASGARMYRIPHRSNRAVIFASRLFHRTDECDFDEGYLNKRINVSFLFGDWVDRPNS